MSLLMSTLEIQFLFFKNEFREGPPRGSTRQLGLRRFRYKLKSWYFFSVDFNEFNEHLFRPHPHAAITIQTLVDNNLLFGFRVSRFTNNFVILVFVVFINSWFYSAHRFILYLDVKFINKGTRCHPLKDPFFYPNPFHKKDNSL